MCVRGMVYVALGNFEEAGHAVWGEPFMFWGV